MVGLFLHTLFLLNKHFFLLIWHLESIGPKSISFSRSLLSRSPLLVTSSEIAEIHLELDARLVLLDLLLRSRGRGRVGRVRLRRRQPVPVGQHRGLQPRLQLGGLGQDGLELLGKTGNGAGQLGQSDIVQLEPEPVCTFHLVSLQQLTDEDGDQDLEDLRLLLLTWQEVKVRVGAEDKGLNKVHAF